MDNDPTLYDIANRPVHQDDGLIAFDTGPLRDASGHLVQSLHDAGQVVQATVQSANTVASLFDGTKRVHLGSFNAPVGLVLLGGVIALLAFHKGR